MAEKERRDTILGINDSPNTRRNLGIGDDTMLLDFARTPKNRSKKKASELSTPKDFANETRDSLSFLSFVNPVGLIDITKDLINDPGGTAENITRSIAFVGEDLGDAIFGEDDPRIGAEGWGIDADGNPRNYNFDINSFGEQLRAAELSGEIIRDEALFLYERATKLPRNSEGFEAGIQQLRSELKSARAGKGRFAGTQRLRESAKQREQMPQGRKQTFLGGKR